MRAEHPPASGGPRSSGTACSREGEETVMVTRSTEVEEQGGSRAVGPVVQAVGGLLLALAVVAAIGGRHLAERHHSGPVAVQPATAKSVLGVAPTAPVPARTVYLVATQDG